jgi:hypothetical protein
MPIAANTNRDPPASYRVFIHVGHAKCDRRGKKRRLTGAGRAHANQKAIAHTLRNKIYFLPVCDRLASRIPIIYCLRSFDVYQIMISYK